MSVNTADGFRDISITNLNELGRKDMSDHGLTAKESLSYAFNVMAAFSITAVGLSLAVAAGEALFGGAVTDAGQKLATLFAPDCFMGDLAGMGMVSGIAAGLYQSALKLGNRAGGKIATPSAPSMR